MAALSEPLIIGDIRIDRIVELVKDYYPAVEFFRDLTPEERQQFGLPPVVQAE